jgi:penicillin-binding protein-related factor A (putative recombinase)
MRFQSNTQNVCVMIMGWDISIHNILKIIQQAGMRVMKYSLKNITNKQMDHITNIAKNYKRTFFLLTYITSMASTTQFYLCSEFKNAALPSEYSWNRKNIKNRVVDRLSSCINNLTYPHTTIMLTGITYK